MNFKSIREAIQSIGNERRQLAREIEEKRERREWLLTGPEPFEEYAQLLDDKVDAAVLEFDETFGLLTEGKLNKPGQPFPEQALLIARNNSAGAFQAALFGMYPEASKHGLREAAKRKGYPPDSECVPAKAVRLKELDRLNREIADLETKLSELDDQIEQTANEMPRERIKLSGKPVRPSRRDPPQLIVDGPLFEVPAVDEPPADDGAVRVTETAADGAGNPSSGKES